MTRSRRPMIALVGRPNVGKSTLFNRLIGRKRAIVENTPGVTRDRHYADVELRGRPVTVVDTGGFVPSENSDALESLVRFQAQAAVEECDVVLLVTDAQVGMTSADDEVAHFLRKAKRQVVLVVNKVDDTRQADVLIADFHKVGLGEPFPVSAEHDRGTSELVDRIDEILGPYQEPEAVPEDPNQPIRVAIVGRPNVGKSTLVNKLLGTERVIVSPVAGTTRDPIDSPVTTPAGRFVLTDTAGIRRKATISQKVEQFSVFSSLRVLEDCDVAVLVVDAQEPAVDQDARIAGVAEEKGRPLLIVVNKWDLKRGQVKEDAFRDEFKYLLKWLAYAPVLFISAKEGYRVNKVLELVAELHRQANSRAGTPMLNRLLEHVTTEHPLPFHNGSPLKLYYVAQVGSAPPTFQFVCNRPQHIPDRYKRYLLNQLRGTFELKVPVRLLFRERPGKRDRADAVNEYKNRKKNERRGQKNVRPSIKQTRKVRREDD